MPLWAISAFFDLNVHYSDRVRAISVAMGLTPVMWTRISPLATFDTDGWFPILVIALVNLILLTQTSTSPVVLLLYSKSCKTGKIFLGMPQL